MDIVFVTSNARKFAVAQHSVAGHAIVLQQQTLDLPELQSTSVEEVGKFKAVQAAELLQQPVVITDGGFYFHALHGFPGPFIKFINVWLEGEDLFRLMEGKVDRRIEAIECLSYCRPGGEPRAFTHSFWGKAALELGQPGRGPIDAVFIPEGYAVTMSSISEADQVQFWGSGSNWQQLINWLKSKEA